MAIGIPILYSGNTVTGVYWTIVERLWNTLLLAKCRETQTNRSAVLSHMHHVNIHIIQQESASIALFPFNPILHRAANPGGIHFPPPPPIFDLHPRNNWILSRNGEKKPGEQKRKKRSSKKEILKSSPPNIKKVTKICWSSTPQCWTRICSPDTTGINRWCEAYKVLCIGRFYVFKWQVSVLQIPGGMRGYIPPIFDLHPPNNWILTRNGEKKAWWAKKRSSKKKS